MKIAKIADLMEKQFSVGSSGGEEENAETPSAQRFAEKVDACAGYKAPPPEEVE